MGHNKHSIDEFIIQCYKVLYHKYLNFNYKNNSNSFSSIEHVF